jgi:hypothetical protein
MHRSGGGQRFFEIKVNSRHPVMAVVELSRFAGVPPARCLFAVAAVFSRADFSGF